MRPKPTSERPQTNTAPISACPPARRPAAGRGADERAERGRGVEQSDHAGAAAELLVGEDRVERLRHREDHRRRVDEQQPDDEPVPPDEPDAVRDGPERLPQPLAGGARLRRGQRAYEEERHREDQEPGRVDRETGGEPGARDEHPAERGPEQRGQLRGGRRQRARRREAFGADEGGDGRHHRRSAEPREESGEAGRQVDHPQLRLRKQGVDHEARRDERQREPGDEHQQAPVAAVGEDTADQYADDQRERPRQADQADLQRRSGEVVDLHGDRDARHEGADQGAEESGVQQPEVAALAERGEVHGETGTGHERLQEGELGQPYLDHPADHPP
nr:hypothetical protein [Streptomyces formicae]